MKLFSIVFLLAVVCLAAVAAREGGDSGEGPHRPPKPHGPPTTRTTTTTTTTVQPMKTRKPRRTTSTTTSTTTTSTTTPKPPRRTRPTTVNPTTQSTTTTVPPRTLTCTAVALTDISESPCGTCTLLTSRSGTIESLHFPNDYGVYNASDSFINCLYTIKAPQRRRIQLIFTTFTVEKKFDLINVYDGVAPSGTILAANLTGYSLPPAPLTTVETNLMSVVFNTDRNNAGLPMRFRPAKWQAAFKVVP